MKSEQVNNDTSASIRSRLEQSIYLSLGALLLIVLVLYLRGRGISLTRTESMSTITQIGSVIIVSYAVVLMGFAIRRSVYARRMILSAASVAFSLILVEGALQICDCTSGVVEARIDRGALNAIDLIFDERAKGVDINPAFSAVALREAAAEKNSDLFLSHISNTMVVMSDEDDGLISTQSDENGFRNPPGLYDRLEAFDVFLIGDSFTEGWSVPDGFTIADNIRQTTAYTVYNGGLGSAGLLHNLAVFIEFGVPKEPANVVIIMPEVLALHRALNELEFERLHKYYTDHLGSNLLGKNYTKDRVLREYIAERLPGAREIIANPPVGSFSDRVARQLKAESKIVQLVLTNRALFEKLRFVGKRTIKVEGNSYQGEGVPGCDDLEERRTVMRDIVSWIDQRVDEYGGTLIIAYVPAVRYFGYSNWPECEHDMVIETSKELNIPLVDVIPFMNGSDDPAEYFARNSDNPNLGGHPSRDGYRLIAEQIVARIQLESEGTAK